MTKKKIKDLADFDVFNYSGQNFVHLGESFYNLFFNYSDEYDTCKLEEEVEVLGRMEFIRTGP